MPPEQHSEGACDAAFAAIANGDYSDWQGLPADCPLGAFLERFPPVNDGVGKFHLGSSFRSMAFRVSLPPRTGDEPLRAWFDERRVVLVDMEASATLASRREALVAALGEPEAKLESYFGVLELKDAEWVYPERGITLIIDPEDDRLMRVLLYPRTDLDTYQRELRIDFEEREIEED